VGVGFGNRNLRAFQRWGRRESRDSQNLLLVEALPLQQGPSQPVEFSAMFREEPPSLLVALTNDP